MDLTVIKYGTKAQTKIGNIEGIITGFKVSGESNQVEYEFTYFTENMEYKVVILNECELTALHKEKVRIGFLNN